MKIIVSTEKKKMLLAQLKNRNKNRKPSSLNWLPMEFTRDTIDGGELTNRYRHTKYYRAT